ncbi:MAG: pentapeptide repeat-containing protein [Xanthobacteraceae bacterium]
MTKAAQANEMNAFRLDVHGAYLRRTDLSFSNLERANLSGADFSNATLRGANFKDAILDGTILRGADLSEAKNLTPSQLNRAILDETTRLPENLSLANIMAHRPQAEN